MAKQKTSRKAFATTAAAVMAATAVTPVAAFAASTKFPDVPASGEYADAINNLVGQGILNGFEDGTFKPNDPVLREQAAKILATALKLDTTGTENYPDVSTDNWSYKYIVAVTKAGIFGGDENGKFNPFNNLTRQEAAKIIVQAFGFTGSTELTFGDKANIQSWAVPYVKTAVANGILKGDDQGNFNPNANIKRGDFALMIQRALNAVENAKTPKVESVSAINAKTLEVKFNTAVDDTKAKIAVKKGSVTTNVAKVTFSKDKKSAQIELASKLTKGEYTVTVTGLTDKALTKTYTAEDEKVADINILSDKAIINGSSVEVRYEVLNQYGEDITKTTTLNSVSSLGAVSADPSKGVLTIPIGSAKVGDTFTLNLVHVDTAVSENATLKISDASVVSEVSIRSLYHETGKELTADETNISDYALVVDVTDQYGNKLTATEATRDLLVRVSDTTVVSVDGLNTTNNKATFSTVKIDGKDQTVLKLSGGLKAGKSTITLISQYTGKSSSYEVTVNEGLKVNTITLSQPELVVAGETVEIPFEATDMYGNPITKASALNNGVTFSVSGTGTFSPGNLSFDVDSNGKAVLKFAVPNNATGNVTVTAITANQKVASLTVNVKDAAKPVAITGLDPDVYTNVLEGENLTFNTSDLIAEDQYGRTMNGTKLATFLGDTSATPTNGDLFVKVEGADSTGGAIANPTKPIIGSAGDTSTAVTGSARGTEELKFTLVKYNATTSTLDPVVGSEFKKSIRVVKQSDITSYDVVDVPTLYDELGNGLSSEVSAYDYTVKVYGKLSNGTKVFVPATYYNVSTNHEALVATGNVLNVANTGGTLINYGDSKETTLKATVTINSTGDSIVKDVKVSKAAPKVATVAFDEDLPVVSKVGDNFVIVDNAADVDEAKEFFALLKLKDQYGILGTVATTGIVTFADSSVTTIPATVTYSNIVDSNNNGNLKVTDNGTATAQLLNLESGDSFTTTITFANGVSTSSKVLVK